MVTKKSYNKEISLLPQMFSHLTGLVMWYLKKLQKKV